MKQHGRLYNSVFNLMSGFGFRILSMITAFLVRTVFVKCLDASYLGVSGLFSNILTMLSLAELGFGTAMVYSLYSPLATKDGTKIRQLMTLYRHVYTIIGTVILVIGVSLLPFLDSISITLSVWECVTTEIINILTRNDFGFSNFPEK